MQRIRTVINDHPCVVLACLLASFYLFTAIYTLHSAGLLPQSWGQFKEITHARKQGSIDGTAYPHPKGGE
jgi:hypothetical protein